jgi:hypothetical protein
MEGRGPQVAPSGEVRMVPSSPTTTVSAGEAAAPWSAAVVPLVRRVQDDAVG